MGWEIGAMERQGRDNGKDVQSVVGLLCVCVSVSVPLTLFLSVLLHLPASLPSPLESIRHQGEKNERNVNRLLSRREGTVRGVINIKKLCISRQLRLFFIIQGLPAQ